MYAPRLISHDTRVFCLPRLGIGNIGSNVSNGICNWELVFWNSHWPLGYALECWLLFEIEGRWVCLRYKGISFNFWLINSPETRFERLPIFAPLYRREQVYWVSWKNLIVTHVVWVMCCLLCFRYGLCVVYFVSVIALFYCSLFWMLCTAFLIGFHAFFTFVVLTWLAWKETDVHHEK